MSHDQEEDTEPELIQVNGEFHRFICFLASLIALVVLVRVVIVAAPGYDFHLFFGKSEILSKADSIIIRGVSIVAVLPLLILTPLSFLSLFSYRYALKLNTVLARWSPFMNWLDKNL